MKNFGKSPQTKRVNTAYTALQSPFGYSTEEDNVSPSPDDGDDDGLDLYAKTHKLAKHSGGFWHSESFDIDKSLTASPKLHHPSNESTDIIINDGIEEDDSGKKKKIKTMDFHSYYIEHIETVSSDTVSDVEQLHTTTHGVRIDKAKNSYEGSGDDAGTVITVRTEEIAVDTSDPVDKENLS